MEALCVMTQAHPILVHGKFLLHGIKPIPSKQKRMMLQGILPLIPSKLPQNKKTDSAPTLFTIKKKRLRKAAKSLVLENIIKPYQEGSNHGK